MLSVSTNPSSLLPSAFNITPFHFLFFSSDIVVIGDITNIILDPILMFVLHMGVIGAAIAHVISQ